MFLPQNSVTTSAWENLYPLIYTINRLNQSVNPCGLALTQDYGPLIYTELHRILRSRFVDRPSIGFCMDWLLDGKYELVKKV
jgi:hypothetical protein